MKENFKLSDYSLITAKPTCGKSTLVANCDEFVLDSDLLTFNLSSRWMTPGSYELFKTNHNRTGSPQHQFKLFLEQMYFMFMNFSLDGCTWITNLTPPKDIMELFRERGRTLCVTRDAVSAWELLETRSRERNAPLNIEKHEVERWMSLPGRAQHDFDDVVVLEDGEYLCDLFGIVPEITDAAEVDKLVLEQFVQAFEIPTLKREGGLKLW